MTALAEALLAAQRQAIGALSKAYVADNIEVSPFCEWLDALGCRDVVDQGRLLAALNAVKQFGAPLPGANGTKPDAENEPASDAQWTLLRKLADERKLIAPDGPLTKAQASKAITELKAGTYKADDYVAPF